jgi:hypothetical protein
MAAQGYRARPGASMVPGESWLEAHRYLSMDDLREHKKEALRMAA